MYYPDLSKYEYMSNTPLDSVFNVGWLDEAHPFETGETDELVVALLASRYHHLRACPTRGYHHCQLCGEFPVEANVDGQAIPLGSAELWIPHQGAFFAAPDLIIHYLRQHQYRPPAAFLSAVLALSDLPADWRSTAAATYQQQPAWTESDPESESLDLDSISSLDDEQGNELGKDEL